MKCKTAKANLDDFLKCNLNEPTLSELKAHLKSCPKCAQELRFLETLHQKIAGLPEEKAPANLLARVHERIDASEKPRFLPQYKSWAPLLARVAAALILGVVLINIANHSLVNQLSPKRLPQSGTVRTFKNEAPPVSAVQPAKSDARNKLRMTPADAEKPVSGVVVPAQLEAPAASPGNEQLAVKVILTTANNDPGTNKISEEQADNAQISSSKGLSFAKKEKSDTADPVRAFLDKYHGRVVKTETSSSSEEWAFEIPTQDYQAFVADLAKIGRITEEPKAAGADAAGEKEKKVQLQLILE